MPRALEVVDRCAGGLWDGLEAAVGVVVVELGDAAVGKAGADGAGGARGELGGGVGRGGGEGVAALQSISYRFQCGGRGAVNTMMM